jgi:copper chaperone CopZ
MSVANGYTLVRDAVAVLSYLCPLGEGSAAAGQREDSAPVHRRRSESASAREVAVIELRVPRMTSRQCVRAVTAAVRDLAGVDTVQADWSTASLIVGGTVSEAELRIVLTQIGFAADGQRDSS